MATPQEDLDDLEKRLNLEKPWFLSFTEFPSNPSPEMSWTCSAGQLADKYDFAVVIDETRLKF